MWRKTPQTLLIREILAEKGHATNQDLAAAARKHFPDITNTTVHRITARLVKAGFARYAPSLGNVKIVDTNTNHHDHFVCKECQHLIDITLDDDFYRLLQEQLPSALSRQSVLVAGVCKKCEFS